MEQFFQPVWSHNTLPLFGNKISLLPLDFSHFDRLIQLGKDERIWASYPVSRADPRRHHKFLSDTIREVSKGNCVAFAIESLDTQGLAGMTRIYHLDPFNKQCEIGSWLNPNFWQAGINVEAKYLLLCYCFEALQMMRVQFKTDVSNVRSRLALTKLGARLEGTIRKERMRDNGTFRDAALYSIIDDEWAEVKDRLLTRMALGQSPESRIRYLIEVNDTQSISDPEHILSPSPSQPFERAG